MNWFSQMPLKKEELRKIKQRIREVEGYKKKVERARGNLERWFKVGRIEVDVYVERKGKLEELKKGYDAYLGEARERVVKSRGAPTHQAPKEKLLLLFMVVMTAGLLLAISSGLAGWGEESWLGDISTRGFGWLTGAAFVDEGTIGIAAAPTIDSLVLNSTLGTNLSSENLTAYVNAADADGDNVSVNYDWRLEDTSIAVVNMNFDVNNSGGTGKTKDYSIYGNNGTVTGATWNATAGHENNGAYEFDGTNDKIVFAADDVGSAGSFSMWVKPDASMQAAQAVYIHRLLSTGATNHFGFWDWDNGKLYVGWYPNTEERIVVSNNNITYDTWNHIAFVWDNSVPMAKLYIDGEEIGSKSDAFNVFTLDNLNLGLGSGGTYEGNYDFNGVIDNFIVFNHSLSAEQVSALYNNRTDLIVSQETDVGDNWSVCVTPNDGDLDGNESCSNNLTILETPPQAKISLVKVTLTPSVFINDSVFFNITVNNTGGTNITEIYMVDKYDSTYLDFENATGPVPLTSVNETIGIIIWNISAGGDTIMEPGEYATFTLNFTALTNATSVTNYVNITIVDYLSQTAYDEDSSTVMISTIPSIDSVILNSTFGTNYTTENLTAYPINVQNANAGIFDWRKEGTSIAVLNMNFDVNNSAGAGKTKDYSTYQNNGTITNAVWSSSAGWNYTGAYEFNGIDNYISVNDLVSEIEDDNEGTVSIWFKTSMTGVGLLITQNDFSEDGDFFSLSVNYVQNSGTIEGDLGTSGDWRFYGNTVVNDGKWHHLVVTSNGTKNIFYVDGQIENVTFTQGSNDGTWFNDAGPGQDTFSIGVIDRASKTGYFNGTIDNLQILSEPISPEQVLTLYNNRTDLIVSQETSVGDNWSVCVTPNDGDLDGNESCSGVLEVVEAGGGLETPVLLTPEDGNHTDERNPTFIWNNSVGSSVSYEILVDDDNFTSPEINVSGIVEGENVSNYTAVIDLDVDTTYYWKVRANDSGTLSDWSETFNFTIDSYIAVSMIRKGVDFGAMSINDSDNTTDNSPLPFLIENAGNIPLNITINGSALFTSVPFPSAYYQFKIAENETGSFNTTLSEMDWTNVTNVSIDTFVFNLDWHSDSNTFETEILVNTPDSEPPGTKTSTLVFKVR